jgi:hypothetical protein
MRDAYDGWLGDILFALMAIGLTVAAGCVLIGVAVILTLLLPL